MPVPQGYKRAIVEGEDPNIAKDVTPPNLEDFQDLPSSQEYYDQQNSAIDKGLADIAQGNDPGEGFQVPPEMYGEVKPFLDNALEMGAKTAAMAVNIRETPGERASKELAGEIARQQMQQTQLQQPMQPTQQSVPWNYGQQLQKPQI